MTGDEVASGLVRRYVEGWKAGDSAAILSTLSADCVIIESHGPTYRGKEQTKRWARSWFAEGNTIDDWDITSLLVSGDVCVFEWVFSCTVGGVRKSFEGASWARVGGHGIALLREYRMTESRYEWTG
jgi:ketosteroid isomerase-like protein